jgi:hypothetical protein
VHWIQYEGDSTEIKQEFNRYHIEFILWIVIDKAIACHDKMSFVDVDGTSNFIIELVSNNSLSVSCVVEIDRWLIISLSHPHIDEYSAALEMTRCMRLVGPILVTIHRLDTTHDDTRKCSNNMIFVWLISHYGQWIYDDHREHTDLSTVIHVAHMYICVSCFVEWTINNYELLLWCKRA